MLELSYRAARARVAELVAGLDVEQLQTPVPATPGWSVHDLLAHVVGVAADTASGRLDGAPGEAWTARHVAERRELPVDQLLAEWARVGPAVEEGLIGQRFTGPGPAPDLICHEADLREALGLRPVDREHWQQPYLETMLRALGKRLTGVATVVVRDEDGGEWRCGSGESDLMLHAYGYELLRGVFSRRSRRQIAGWDWSVPPAAEVIDRFGTFGPRDDDQPTPV